MALELFFASVPIVPYHGHQSSVAPIVRLSASTIEAPERKEERHIDALPRDRTMRAFLSSF